jgi:hypothetical protein
VCGFVIEFLGEAFAEFVEVGTKGVEFRDGGEVVGVDGGSLGASGGAFAEGPGEARAADDGEGGVEERVAEQLGLGGGGGWIGGLE